MRKALVSFLCVWVCACDARSSSTNYANLADAGVEEEELAAGGGEIHGEMQVTFCNGSCGESGRFGGRISGSHRERLD